MIIFISSSVIVCFIILLLIIKFLNVVWWDPIRVQSALRSQGINSLPYKFIYGNAKDIIRMRAESISTSMELSHQIFPRLQPQYYLWNKLYGKKYISWLGLRPQLIITEPQLIKEILNNKDELYPKPYFGSYIDKLFGDGLLVTSNVEKWFRQRKLANHAFHGDNLKDMIPSMIASVEMMLERWRVQNEAKEIEVYKEFKELTAEVISRTAFGSSYLEGQHIFGLLGKLILIVSKNIFEVRIPVINKIIKTKDEIESEKLQRDIRDSILRMIKKREEEAKMGGLDSYGSDYLGVLIKANRDADETKQISIDDLVDECKTFYIAGHETTSSTLTWTVFLLAIYPDWQEKARKEVLELFGHKGNPTLDEINRLKLMNMIINESLRLYNPFTMIVREVQKGSKLGNVVAPARIDIIIPTLAIHHDPEIWGEDVHLFKPERFAEGVARATRNNIAAFCPFGFGPRNCVGTNFAMAETKIALAMILQRYSFTLSPTYVHSPVILLAVSPQKGLQILFRHYKS